MLFRPDDPRVAELPAAGCAARVVEVLRTSGAAVVVAPPGTGKTTVLPLALADAADLAPGPDRIVVSEPRRLAARAAAARLAELAGARLGEEVGYTVRGERRAGPGTRVEVVTHGVLLARLLRDPELPGVAAVMVDEAHERGVDTDLVLALLADVRRNLRADLGLVTATATPDLGRLLRLAGDGDGPAPDDVVVRAEVRRYPVEVRRVEPGGGALGVTFGPDDVAVTARVVGRALDELAGDVLVFLPGRSHIARVARALASEPAARGVDLTVLHGGMDVADQVRALSPGASAPSGARARRVVLATPVAESSVTVPGVRVVVDSGLVRVPRFDVARGLGRLVTERVSRASADQRAGRAGREGPGVVYRLWSERVEATMPSDAVAEITGADLTELALRLAAWGSPDGADLDLADRPPRAALRAAQRLLTGLGAVDGRGATTPLGRRLLGLGVHPRWGRALLDTAPVVGARRAAQIVAALSDDTLARGGAAQVDAVARWRSVRSDASRRWTADVRRFEDAVRGTRPGTGEAPPRVADDRAVALVVAAAFPERVARRRAAPGAEFLLASGTAVTVPDSALASAEWLAVADAGATPGRADARVRLAAAIDQDDAVRAATHLVRRTRTVAWAADAHGVGDVRARQVVTLGAVELESTPLGGFGPELAAPALRAGLRAEGPGLLHVSDRARALRPRLGFLHRVLGAPWPAVDDTALVDWLEAHWAEFFAPARRRADLARVDLGQVLARLLPWPEAARLDELAPERLPVPSGSRVRVDYSGDVPVLAVKLQEMFGAAETPRVAGGRVAVRLELLSPAGRPAAVTQDLASFWHDGYRQARAELRGRYPKHPWPEDPWSAPATRFTTRRAR